MTYNAGQFNKIIPAILEMGITPEWLVLGGPADGDEAQCCLRQWPEIRIIGVEPNHHMVMWQMKHDWPVEARLIPAALSNYRGQGQMRHDPLHPRCDSFMMERSGIVTQVDVLTIDSLDGEYGPVSQAILWLDVEGHELEALQGAQALIDRDGILAIYVELIERREKESQALIDFIESNGFILAGVYNVHPSSHHDRLYLRGPSGYTIDMSYNLDVILRECLKHCKREIKSVLEIGVYEGKGAETLIDVLIPRSGEYVGMDPWEYPHQDARIRAINNLKRYRPRVQLLEEYSRIALPSLYKSGQRFDFIYVDGCHSFEAVLDDLAQSSWLLSPGGVILVDDYGRDDYGVKRAVGEHLSRDTSLQVMHQGYYAILRKEPVSV